MAATGTRGTAELRLGGDRHRLLPALVGIALGLPACSLALGYPADAVEVGALCHDGEDQDLDGRRDCDDPDCAASCDERASCEPTGSDPPVVDDDEDGLVGCDDPDCDGHPACPEDLPPQCADGRDNDGDGRIDARDAGCWPHVAASIDRCASVLGGTLVLGPDDFVGGTMEEDPLGTGEGPWRRAPPYLRATAASVRRASGTIDGTTATFVLEVGATYDADGTVRRSVPSFLVALTEPSSTRTDAPVVAGVLALNGVGADVLDSDLTTVARADLPAVVTATRVEVRLELTLDVITARITVGSLAPVVVSGTRGAPVPPTVALGLAVAAPGSAPVWLVSAEISRPTLERCGGLEPPIGVGEVDGVVRANTALLSLVRAPDDVLCGTVAMGDRGVHTISIRSDDDGATFVRGDDVVPSGGARPFFSPPGTIAFDPVAGTYHAAAVRNRWGTSELEISVASSTDCLHWTRPEVAAPIPTSLDGRLLVHPISPSPFEHTAGPEGHLVRLYVLDDLGAGFLVARSPWGDPGTWTFDAELDRSAPPFEGDAERFARIFVSTQTTRPGAEVLLGARAVRTSRAWEDVAWLASFGASEEAGAFDAAGQVRPVALLEDACDPPSESVLCGRLFYTGTYDVAGLEEAGWGHARVRLVPTVPR